MKQIFNDALRGALAPAQRGPPYHLIPHESSLRPGFGAAGFNRLAAELRDEAILDVARTSPAHGGHTTAERPRSR